MISTVHQASASAVRRNSAEFVFRLYVTAATPASARAVVNARGLFEKHIKGRYQLEIVNIADCVESAMKDQIIAAPTLVMLAPAPPRRFIGDLSNPENLLRGLGIRAADAAVTAAEPH